MKTDPIDFSLLPLSLDLPEFYGKLIFAEFNKTSKLWQMYHPRPPRSLWTTLKANATRRRNKAAKVAVYTPTK